MEKQDKYLLSRTFSASGKYHLCLLNAIHLGIISTTHIIPSIECLIKLLELHIGYKHDGTMLEVDMVSSIIASNPNYDSNGLQIRNMIKLLCQLYNISIVLHKIESKFGQNDEEWFICKEMLEINGSGFQPNLLNPGFKREGIKKVRIATDMHHFYLMLDNHMIDTKVHINNENDNDNNMDYNKMTEILSQYREEWNKILDETFPELNTKSKEDIEKQVEDDRLYAVQLVEDFVNNLDNS